MPAPDKNSDHEGRDLDRERGDKDTEREKGPKSKGPSKAKDLSHVPCKFFKVGSCTAGSSCPFSHSLPEPGQHKDVCAWFVKGNCKFGHKCALAHILPGQSMAMDRKNKKAAQAAAHGSNSGGGQKGNKGHKSSPQNGSAGAASGAGSSGGGQARNPLLAGSTAPTRILTGPSSRPMPMSLKAAVSPSAPAPPLKDTDFASFGLPDESNKLASAPAQGTPSATAPSEDKNTTERAAADAPAGSNAPSPAPLPVSTPSARSRPQDANAADLGPIGSPPRAIASPGQPARINGFSPGTSPAQNPTFVSGSPFSAPGGQSLFLSEPASDFRSRSGLAASLGATHTWQAASQQRHGGIGEEVVVEDEDLEEFIPSSLTDLLTPEERSRRYSRNNAPHAPALPAPGPRPSVETHHHRYSHSVPAPSLLGDIKSIWSDNNQGLLGSPRRSIDHSAGTPVTGGLAAGANAGAAPLGGGGTPSSLRSSSAFGGRSLADDHAINAFLSPSNASAAFLPSNYQHYYPAKARAGTLRPGAYTPTSSTVALPGSANAANLLARINEPPRTPFDGTAESLGGQPFQLGRPRSRGAGAEDALHAPGQSLPQGLAAGYSRIHALPPPPVIPSPATSGALGFAPGTSAAAHGSLGDWIGMSPGAPGMAEHLRNGQQQQQPHGAFESAVPRPSYSAAAAARQPAAPSAPGSRVPSGGKAWLHGTPLSPLSGPVVTGDDDDLFSMDG